MSNFQVEVLADFYTSRYSGVFCGVTVFSVVAALEGQTPFHSITMPLVDTLNRMGLSTSMYHGRVHHQYVPRSDGEGVPISKHFFHKLQIALCNACCRALMGLVCALWAWLRRPRQPLLHLYYYLRNPGRNARARRYIAYQMEYSKSMVESEECMQCVPVLVPYATNMRVTFIPLTYHTSYARGPRVLSLVVLCPDSSFAPRCSRFARADTCRGLLQRGSTARPNSLFGIGLAWRMQHM